MKIPDELKGKEVKKFEEIYFHELVNGDIADKNRYGKIFSLTQIIRDFYTQKFTPDMIEEYFDVELLVEDSSITDSFWLTIGKVTVKHLTDYKALTFKPRPKTLSDFIDACLNSGITLRYRK